MGDVLLGLIGILIVVTAGAVVASRLIGSHQRSIARSPTLALQAGDTWYRHAVHMARLLDRLRDDPMVSCTIDAPMLDEMRQATERFWSDVDE